MCQLYEVPLSRSFWLVHKSVYNQSKEVFHSITLHILSSQLTDKTLYVDMRQSFWLVVHQSLDQSEALIHLGSSKIMTEEQIFWGQDAIKGTRNYRKILIVLDMHQTLQHDAKTNWSKFKIAFFQHGPTGEFEACQKIIFEAKICVEVSKQLKS